MSWFATKVFSFSLPQAKEVGGDEDFMLPITEPRQDVKPLLNRQLSREECNIVSIIHQGCCQPAGSMVSLYNNE